MIHVYSVQPTALQDLNVLTDVCREVFTAHAQDDPLECGKDWGMIQNRNVKVKVPLDTDPLSKSHNEYSEERELVHRHPQLSRHPSPRPNPQSLPSGHSRNLRLQQRLKANLRKRSLSHHQSQTLKRPPRPLQSQQSSARRAICSAHSPRLSQSRRLQLLPSR
jgi:hypothetical protein